MVDEASINLAPFELLPVQENHQECSRHDSKLLPLSCHRQPDGPWRSFPSVWISVNVFRTVGILYAHPIKAAPAQVDQNGFSLSG